MTRSFVFSAFNFRGDQVDVSQDLLVRFRSHHDTGVFDARQVRQDALQAASAWLNHNRHPNEFLFLKLPSIPPKKVK